MRVCLSLTPSSPAAYMSLSLQDMLRTINVTDDRVLKDKEEARAKNPTPRSDKKGTMEKTEKRKKHDTHDAHASSGTEKRKKAKRRKDDSDSDRSKKEKRKKDDSDSDDDSDKQNGEKEEGQQRQ